MHAPITGDPFASSGHYQLPLASTCVRSAQILPCFLQWRCGAVSEFFELYSQADVTIKILLQTYGGTCSVATPPGADYAFCSDVTAQSKVASSDVKRAAAMRKFDAPSTAGICSAEGPVRSVRKAIVIHKTHHRTFKDEHSKSDCSTGLTATMQMDSHISSTSRA